MQLHFYAFHTHASNVNVQYRCFTTQAWRTNKPRPNVPPGGPCRRDHHKTTSWVRRQTRPWDQKVIRHSTKSCSGFGNGSFLVSVRWHHARELVNMAALLPCSYHTAPAGIGYYWWDLARYSTYLPSLLPPPYRRLLAPALTLLPSSPAVVQRQL